MRCAVTLVLCAAYAHGALLGPLSSPSIRNGRPAVGSCHSQPRRADQIICMGVSDRTANNGMLYDGWGAEGMRTLNSTSRLQQNAVDQQISHYDAVLIVAARAKENAYQAAEDQPGYIGNSFDGPMGSGMRRPPPAKSQVITAIEELNAEFDEKGCFPELVTPGIPDELLEMMAAESAAEASAKLAEERAKEQEELAAAKRRERDAAAAARATAEADDDDELSPDLLDSLLAEEEESPLGVVEGASMGKLADDVDGIDDDEDELDPLATDDDDDKGAVEMLAELLGETAAAEAGVTDDAEDEDDEEDFDDDLDLEGEGGLASLFSDLSYGGDSGGGIEASGMSPGDRG